MHSLTYTPTAEDIANAKAEDAWKARQRAAGLLTLQALVRRENAARAAACVAAYAARTGGQQCD